MSHGHNATAASNPAIRYFYLVTVFFLTLTGFGQMPIFKRYYIVSYCPTLTNVNSHLS